MLTRKNYKELSKLLATLWTQRLIRWQAIELIIDWLKTINPRFDKNRFEIALDKEIIYAKNRMHALNYGKIL